MITRPSPGLKLPGRGNVQITGSYYPYATIVWDYINRAMPVRPKVQMPNRNGFVPAVPV